LITVIPLFSSSDGQVEYFVGLQVDLVEQPNSILEKMKSKKKTKAIHNDNNDIIF
jgi:hypothetical protein